MTLLAARASGGVEDNAAIARDYAPAIWLAQQEPFYPMMPHPFAFDGIDNDRDGCFDLADSDETTLNDVGDRKAHLRDLRAIFGRLQDIRRCMEQKQDRAQACAQELEPEPERPPQGPCVDLHEVRSVADFHVCGPLWGSGEFRCGPEPTVIYSQPSSTLRGEDVGAHAGPMPWGGIQYWLYYPYDTGHIDDGEHVTLFFDSKASELKAAIGNGHNRDTANNILYASKDSGATVMPPRTLPRHMPFLVELGKHASAPDLNCNGRFDVGVDANVGPQGAWGSRDVIVSIDKKPIGPFQVWMSAERDQSGFLVEGSSFDKHREEWKAGCAEPSPGRSVLDGLPTIDAHQKGGPVSTHSYRLVAGETLRDVLDPFHAGAEGPRTFAETVAILDRQRQDLWGGRAPTSVVASVGGRPCAPPGDEQALCVMPSLMQDLAKWAEFPGDRASSRRDVWTHPDYGKYKADFKRHLFPTLSLGAGVRSTGGNTKLGPLLRFAGIGPFHDSSIDVGVYLDGLGGLSKNDGYCDPCLSDITVTYNAFRTTYRGFYAGLTWNRRNRDYRQVTLEEAGRPSRQVVLNEDTGASPSPFAGVAFSMMIPETVWRIPLLRLLRPPTGFWNRNRIVLRVGVQGSIREGNTADPSIYSTRSFAQFQVSAEWVFGVYKGERHPLQH